MQFFAGRSAKDNLYAHYDTLSDSSLNAIEMCEFIK